MSEKAIAYLGTFTEQEREYVFQKKLDHVQAIVDDIIQILKDNNIKINIQQDKIDMYSSGLTKYHYENDIILLSLSEIDNGKDVCRKGIPCECWFINIPVYIDNKEVVQFLFEFSVPETNKTPYWLFHNYMKFSFSGQEYPIQTRDYTDKYGDIRVPLINDFKHQITSYIKNNIEIFIEKEMEK